MKKLTRIFASLLTISALTLVPVSVYAQTPDEEVISVDSAPAPETDTLPATGGSEVKAPDTGIAPSNKVAQNTAVFVGGSLLGAGIGLGIVTLRKKNTDQ